MLKARDAKTGLALRKLTWIGVGIITVLLAFFTFQRLAETPAGTTKTVTLNVQGTTFQLEVVDDPSERQQGLSGRERLVEGTGMLFVFEETGEHCFWMKDMRFSIDMIWLDGNKKVVDIREAVTPESYPESFCPDEPARYVIELNAGAARQAGIAVGSELKF